MLLWTSCYCSNFAEMVINLYFCEPAAPDGWCDLGSALAALSSGVLAAIWWGLHHSHVVWTFPPQGRFELFSIKLQSNVLNTLYGSSIFFWLKSWQFRIFLFMFICLFYFQDVYLSPCLTFFLYVYIFDFLSLCIPVSICLASFFMFIWICCTLFLTPFPCFWGTLEIIAKK